jgi:hypothetical protein
MSIPLINGFLLSALDESSPLTSDCTALSFPLDLSTDDVTRVFCFVFTVSSKSNFSTSSSSACRAMLLLGVDDLDLDRDLEAVRDLGVADLVGPLN